MSTKQKFYPLFQCKYSSKYPLTYHGIIKFSKKSYYMYIQYMRIKIQAQTLIFIIAILKNADSLCIDFDSLLGDGCATIFKPTSIANGLVYTRALHRPQGVKV